LERQIIAVAISLSLLGPYRPPLEKMPSHVGRRQFPRSRTNLGEFQFVTVIPARRYRPDLGRHCFCTRWSPRSDLERIATKLDLRGPAFTDRDIDRAIASAMVGLILHHEPATFPHPPVLAPEGDALRPWSSHSLPSRACWEDTLQEVSDFYWSRKAEAAPYTLYPRKRT
jgi:hypothetical protein